MPEMRTANRIVLTGICAYVFLATCWLMSRSPVSRPTEPSVSHAPSHFDPWKALQALKDLLKLFAVAAFILQRALYPLLGEPVDLQQAITAIDNP